jgi:AraC family transcriptional activator FtrA
MAIRDPRRVVALAYDRLCTFEFGIVVEVFALPRPELSVDWYKFSVCSLDPGPIRAMGGVTLQTGAGLRALRQAGTIVIPGWRDTDEVPPESLTRELRRAYAGGARLVSICSGVFVLAAAGLLDGKQVTTHWRYVDRLRSRFPNIRVQPDVLYVDEGNVLTSAGSAAGIDLCLHIVRRDYGADIANVVARRLVVPPHREGDQAQYVLHPIRKEYKEGLAPVLQWVEKHLDQPLTVEVMARKASMSNRTFARRFREETGTTPRQWLIGQRLLHAQRLLETTTDSMDEIAEAAGFGTAATLRQHFSRMRTTTPTAYRRRFSITS